MCTHTHAFRNRQEGWGGTRAQGTPPRVLGFPYTPSILGSPFGLDRQTLGSSRALGGAGEVINLEPCGGSLLLRDPGKERKLPPSWAERVCGGGAGGIGICRGTVGCLCTQGRGVVWEMESQSLEAWYPKRRSITMCLPFLVSFSSSLSDRV